MTGTVTDPNSAPASAAILDQCAEELWSRLQVREPYYRSRAGLPVEQLPTGSLAEAEADSAAAAAIAARLNRIDRAELSPSQEVTADFLLHMAREGQHAAIEWWDSFPVTPYMSIIGISAHLRHIFQPFEFNHGADGERYLSLLTGYALLIRNSTKKMRMLADRGWRVARPAIGGARHSLTGLISAASAALNPAEHRLRPLGGSAPHVGQAIEAIVSLDILPALDELRATLDDDYARRAPEAPGLLHMPGGEDAYTRAIRRHLTEPVTADMLHEMGLQEVRRLTEAMAELRARNGWTASEADFHEELRRSPRSYAPSPDAIGSRYQGYIDRMTAALPSLFRHVPDAPFRIERLPPEAEAGMAYGYYEGPSRAGEAGIYYYNGSGLDQRLQLTAAALILHEAVPGHHFHLARQVENRSLPAIRRETGELSVFNEGWAEYASTLGVEAGIYDDPYDLYGRYLHDRFIAQRLVVDTGLNMFGWSMDQAAAYMRQQTLERDEQIETELLRYSTDWPAQSLAYHYGHHRFRLLRQASSASPAFDIRDFHEAILSEGALPLQTLDRHIARTFPIAAPGAA